MPLLRISEAAELVGVSDDTVRRWVSSGRLTATVDGSHRQVVDGETLAMFLRERVHTDPSGASARNRLTGIVTDVQVDGLMAQVELAAGRYRIVSLMSREAAEELELRPGVPATAVIKATNVVVERKDPTG
jgi:molybdopterin-binding protein